MKIRADKSSIEFYISRLKSLGYKKVSDKRLIRKYEVVLQKGDSTKVLSFTQNGWLSIT